MANVFLGHYPKYITVAKKLSASYFNAASIVWNSLSQAQREALNLIFLWLHLSDQFVYSHRPSSARKGSAYEKEVRFLLSMGVNMGSLDTLFA